jgi:hypothetical protein
MPAAIAQGLGFTRFFVIERLRALSQNLISLKAQPIDGRSA